MKWRKERKESESNEKRVCRAFKNYLSTRFSDRAYALIIIKSMC